jgi:hypothetical protein
MNKQGRIVTRGNHQPHRVTLPFVPVDLHQPLAEGMNGDPHDGVSLGVEVRSAAQRLDGDRIFLDVVGPALEVLLADVPENSRQIARTAQDPRR